MLKTQITGAKYLSPQTNQMTNLNIAVPADSKDTKFGTSDILLAKDVIAYLNTLDSDISKELDAQTDKIDKINESIKQFIDHNLIKIVTELPTTDIDKNCIYLVPNKDGEGNNIFIEYIYVEAENTFEEVGKILAKINLSDYYTKEEIDSKLTIYMSNGIDKQVHLDATIPFVNISGLICTNTLNSDSINLVDEDTNKKISLNVDKDVSYKDANDPIRILLTSDDAEANVIAYNGFTHKTDDEFELKACGYGVYLLHDDDDCIRRSSLSKDNLEFRTTDDLILQMNLGLDSDGESYCMTIGSDEKFKISRSTDNTEGATITGVKSITAFANPSATKVWATDGSTVDLSTKANTSDLDAKANASDVLLKKSASGGYYIEENSNELGECAFAANSYCTASGYGAHAEGSALASGEISHAEGNAIASGMSAHAEGSALASGIESHAEGSATASGGASHAEGYVTTASGYTSHAEGYNTTASSDNSHAEGAGTTASGFCSHAEGTCNVEDIHAIHSVGIGNNTTRKNAEYIYAKNNKYSSNLVDDPKNGYKYLIGVGGYDGVSTDNTTYKSVQEVIADLTSRIEQLETKVKALEDANTPA